MRFGSVCSGIEAASTAWHPLGWQAAWFSEIEPFPSAVLAHHYPNVPNHGDMTKFEDWPDEPIDLLVGGTPCQSFSVAGLRKGLADPRGNLMLTYGAIAARYRPEWLVWENVPGVLSSNGGRDFGTFFGMLGELGYGFAYRVLDAQYFGVAQRRRRVFVVANARSWTRAAAVLFERESLSGHPAPRREAGERVTASLRTRAPGSGGQGTDFEQTIAHTLVARSGSALCAPDIQTYLPVERSTASGKPTFGTLMANAGTKLWLGNQEALSGDYHILEPVAFGWQNSASQGDSASYDVTPTLDKSKTPAVDVGVGASPDLAHCLRSGASKADKPESTAYVNADMAVRRLTPTECERLQGFPDGHTLIPYRGKPAADGPRYKALGNSMAVPVMAWIGRRIQLVEALTKESHV